MNGTGSAVSAHPGGRSDPAVSFDHDDKAHAGYSPDGLPGTLAGAGRAHGGRSCTAALRAIPVTPFHFGDRRQPLFGVLHPAATATPRPTAILICPPWGMEYLRAYRALGQLAARLAEHGFATLRFDYRGTGDSFGDSRGVSLDDWVADTRLASETLRTASGAAGLAMVGLRFGAMLAQHAAASGVTVEALALWDSPPSGEVYVENLQHLDRTVSDARNLYRAPRARLPEPEPDELLGHGWPAPLAAAVAALPGLRSDLGVPLHVFVSRDRTPAEGVESQRLPDAGHWSDSDRLAARWMPTRSCAVVADHLAAVLA